ncbi:MAG: hypothetical protein COZ12_06075 [Deltaproteobacteria bacterium CG_4_10_14_3_um_filter_60_8]|nr:MAG: hypothetical protein COX17_08615 [Deltaproteobacteria bacterium CG23_combo_of_CG06-09_8_20_14_all_60_8]PIY21184.1 MAG: hypothetical protein COZ12_06075 [Deltaproteobacteria bacterium CG_4_10_14_3_um_filter_60_8]
MNTINLNTTDRDTILDDQNQQNIVEKEISNVSMGVIVIMAALIGIWGVACLIGGLAGPDGLIGLGQGFISAVTGL